MRRVRIGNTSRPSLVLPAPGGIRLPIKQLSTTGLRVAVGVVDRAHALREGRMVETADGSDGVRFMVDVVHASGIDTGLGA